MACRLERNLLMAFKHKSVPYYLSFRWIHAIYCLFIVCTFVLCMLPFRRIKLYI